MGLLDRLSVKKVTELIGVDVGTSSIKLCALREGPSGFKVSAMAKRDYDEEILNEGYIIDRDFVAREIREMLQENKIRTKQAACALSSYVVITKVVTLPFLDESELQNNISFEVENAIPFPLKDVYYSYYVLGTEEGRDDRINVQIAAAKKEIVDGFIETFEQAGLNLRIVDVDVFGITNLVEQLHEPKDISILAVDVGASTTNMAIVRGETVQFTREILLGGRQLTNQIERQLHIQYPEAERMKIEGAKDAAHLFEDFSYNIASEINKTINFYVSIKPRENISKIYLTGGGSLLRGLKEQVFQDAKTECEYLNPFLMIDEDEERLNSLKGYANFMAVALYLSSRLPDVNA